MTIKSIDTRYGGCLFRSRLEARWAVCFDHMGIAWEYEPQGFEVDDRLALGAPDAFRYLPDFWLTDLDVWAEVKGSLTHEESYRLLSAASSLSSPLGGCNDGGGKDVVVFGPLTTGQVVGTPIRLHLHKGDLQANCWACPVHENYSTIANDAGQVAPNASTALLRGYACMKHNIHSDYLAALDAGRTARFEHGRRPRKAGAPA